MAVKNGFLFTLVLELDWVLPFLDAGIARLDNKMVTKYTGSQHTQKYINWNLNHPKNMLLVVKGLIHRVHIPCDKKEDLLEELELLRNVFI